MNCIDCDSPEVAREERCADCLEEVRETPDWRRRYQRPPQSQPARHCAACGAELLPMKHQGQARKWCSDACRAWARYHPGEIRTDSICRGCGERFRPPGADKWCITCRSSTRPCEQCNQPMPWRLSQGAEPARFCSRSCVGAHQAAARRKPCSEPGCAKPNRRHGLCKNHARQQFPTPSDLAHARKRNQLKNHVRRGRIRAADAEMIDRDVVGDRDGWRCGICRRKVDRTKLYPHPRSPSLDHVIPQSQGGRHTYANVRISHLSCNVDRSDGGGNEQLALIG